MKIDEFLTDYDFCASYDIHINASPSVVFRPDARDTNRSKASSVGGSPLSLVAI
jgi:hypothetical protein